VSNTEERTLVLVKPDAYAQAQEIEERYRRAGLRVQCHRTVKPTLELIAEHYKEHVGQPYYQGTVDFMLSGLIFAIVIVGFDAVKRVRELNGPTDPTAKEAKPGHIRYDFGGKEMPANAVHASDSVESAKREIALWFPDAA
jgi:nucleoside-diphosphate kinase